MLTKEHKRKISFLKSYRYLNAEIDRKIGELEDWRRKIYNVTGTLSDMPKGKDRQDIIADGIAAINEIEDSINSDIDRLYKLRKEIEEKINDVKDDKQREVLKCRYLDFKTWEEIAYINNYSWQHAFRLHEKALDNIKM